MFVFFLEGGGWFFLSLLSWVVELGSRRRVATSAVGEGEPPKGYGKKRDQRQQRVLQDLAEVDFFPLINPTPTPPNFRVIKPESVKIGHFTTCIIITSCSRRCRAEEKRMGLGKRRDAMTGMRSPPMSPLICCIPRCRTERKAQFTGSIVAPLFPPRSVAKQSGFPLAGAHSVEHPGSLRSQRRHTGPRSRLPGFI